VKSEKSSSAEILEAIYDRRAKTNSSYSRRAFARDLKLSAAFMTNYFKGRRRLSVERAERIARLLAMDKRTAKKFIKSVLMENMEAASPGADLHDLLDDSRMLEYRDVDLDEFQFFNGWYHVAVLDLVGCVDFEANAEWIAKRLGISAEAAFATVERLKRLGLLRVKGGRLVKTNAHLRVPTDKNGNSLVVSFHRQMIEKALQELGVSDERAKERRHISGATMSIPTANIELAKQKIAEFKREMCALLTNGEAEEVVQLNIQFFALTKEPSV
jgi:uncharacterized protein (TIGR02147 family)